MAATPTAKGKIDPVFQDNVQALARSAKTCGEAATGKGARVWQYPKDGDWKDPSDLAGLIKPFDRAAANDLYAKAIADPGSPGVVGDLILEKTQIDYVAIMERGYRARLASPVRCLVHAAARRMGHGDEAGVFLGGLIGYVQDIQSAAGLS